MKKPGSLCLVAIGLLSLMFTVSSSWAQSGRRLHYSTLFNPGTVGTVSGEVVRVEQAFAGSGQDYCVHALLKTPKGQVTAILAPQGLHERTGAHHRPQRPGDGHRLLDLRPGKTLPPGHGGERRPHHETQGSQRPSGLGGGRRLAHPFSLPENTSCGDIPLTPDNKANFMNKAKLNFAIDALMFLCMTAIAGLGFLMKYVLLPGRESTIKYGRRVEPCSVSAWTAMTGAPSIFTWDSCCWPCWCCISCCTGR